jgi:hypothetical protein
MATVNSLRSKLSRRDQLRHALQAPIAAPKYCVLYDVDREEHRTPWFYRQDHAQEALGIIQRKHGAAIIYLD